ncbi:MAG: alpha-amylase [Clostridia bacterium]|nr:alpha-amylase [Clostridia bacterium]
MKRILALLTVCIIVLGSGALLPAQADTTPHTNWYEIFVRSFADSDGDGLGDLNGVREKLPYLTDLGFTGIWLMPIMPSPSYHKYDVTDYQAIDPEYGTLDDFRALIETAHEIGIRVILDLPVNHTSVLHPWFQAAVEALREGRSDDPYIEYYHFSRERSSASVLLEGTDWYYEEQFSGGGMPDLNLDNPAVRDEIKDILAFWLNECDADGFRLDAVTSYYTGSAERNIEFLRFLKDNCETLKPGSFLVGEAWTGLSQIAAYYESGVDSFFLFPASQAEGYIAKALRGRSPATGFAADLAKVRSAIPDGLITPFIGNHDTGRAIGVLSARSDTRKAKFAYALLRLLGGDTFTYYGDEIGMAGSRTDPDKRLAMNWSETERTQQPPGTSAEEYPLPGVYDQLADEDSLLRYIKRVNALFAEWPQLSLQQEEILTSSAYTLTFSRGENDERLYVLLNFSGKNEETIELPLTGLSEAGNLLMPGTTYTLSEQGGVTTITLPPYAVLALQ